MPGIIQTIIALSFTLSYCCLTSFAMTIIMSIQFIRNPSKFMKRTFDSSSPPPKVLIDPKFGDHQFLHLPTTGIKLHAVISGPEDAPLMLFVHGFPEFWYSWRDQILHFQKKFRVCAIDMRGFAESDSPSYRFAYTVPILIEDVKGVLEALGYESCILVGHDWGGVVTWGFAKKYPEMVAKLINMNIPHPTAFGHMMRNGGFRSALTQLLMSYYIFFFQAPFLPELVLRCSDYKNIVAGLKNDMVAPEKVLWADDYLAFKWAASRKGGLGGLNYYRSMLMAEEEIFDTSSPKLSVPSLLIWGTRDRYLHRDLPEASREYVEDLKVNYLDASHWVQQEDPGSVNRFMEDFLA